LTKPLKILNSIFKIQSSTNHGAKFPADWPAKLRDSVPKKTKNLGQSPMWVRLSR